MMNETHLPNIKWNISNKRINEIEAHLESLTKTGTLIYPSKENRYRALKMAPEDVKVVILGQDPYHDGSATGLAFDNPYDTTVSPSLRNILEEADCVRDESSGKSNSWLYSWVDQGVLLLNTALSVVAERPGSHIKYWKNFTSEILQKLNAQDNIIYLAWGNYAQDLIEENITNPTAVVIKTTHPSPFSANKASKGATAFIGSNCFKQVNDALISMEKEVINW